MGPGLVIVLALGLGAVGCGGDDDGGRGEQTTGPAQTTAAAGGNESDRKYLDSQGGLQAEKPLFTERDVEGGGITKAAAQEFEACRHDTDEQSRAELVGSLSDESVTLSTSGSGALVVEETDYQLSPGNTVYEVHCEKR